MGWIRNEWFFDGKFTQDRGSYCLVGAWISEALIAELLVAWDTHQWFVWDDLILGSEDIRAAAGTVWASHRLALE